MIRGRANTSFALICLGLALGTLALYWPLTHHPFILFDDEQYISANPHVTSGLSGKNLVWAFTNGEAANWHPLTWLSHQLDCELFGPQAAGSHHLVNVLLHIANTLLLFLFLRGATGALWRSAFVAAFFAWHPLHVESVAWASERKDTLSTLFWLLTLMAYGRYALLAKGQRSKTKAYYALALGLFTLGLMSKPMVVTLPFVLLLLDFWPLNRWRGTPGDGQLKTLSRLALEKIPFFLLAAAGSAVTYLVQTGAGAEWKTLLLDRLGNAVLAYVRYVGKLFWPTDLALVYSHPSHWPVLLALGALAALAAWTFLCVRQWQRQPYLIFGWLWFLGTLVPTIGIVQVGAQSMADRYTYIPSIGFFIAIVWTLAEFGKARPPLKRIFGLLGSGALVGCLLVTAIQISYWRDNITLFRHALSVTQNNYVAANCLGKAYEKIGDQAHARVLYQETVRLAPRYPQGQFNLAMSLLESGETAAALEHLQAAAALEAGNPDIQYDLGLYFAQRASWTNAANCFGKAVKLRPAFAPAQRNYAQALVRLGRFAEAVPPYRAALQLRPDYAAAIKELATLLVEHPELK